MDMEKCSEIAGPLLEHSAGRGGAAYDYSVLRWNITAMYRCFKWESKDQMLHYIGVDDPTSSYAQGGIPALGTTELRFGE